MLAAVIRVVQRRGRQESFQTSIVSGLLNSLSCPRRSDQGDAGGTNCHWYFDSTLKAGYSFGAPPQGLTSYPMMRILLRDRHGHHHHHNHKQEASHVPFRQNRRLYQLPTKSSNTFPGTIACRSVSSSAHHACTSVWSFLPFPLLSALHHLVIIEFYVDHSVLGHRLDRHALEVDGHPPLQLVRAHVQNLDALAERDIWVVMLVENGKAVVPRILVSERSSAQQ